MVLSKGGVASVSPYVPNWTLRKEGPITFFVILHFQLGICLPEYKSCGRYQSMFLKQGGPKQQRGLMENTLVRGQKTWPLV